MRFVLLSFGFLGWAFYEMSGGSDFDASAIREARLAAIEAAKPAAPAPKPEVVVAEASDTVIDTDPPGFGSDESEVTRVALNLTSIDTGAAVEAALEENGVAVPQNVPVVTSSADTPAIIPSLIDPTDGVAPQSVGFADIRTVSGNRVNVRGGPGTDFNVVARLVRGDEVKVLEDNGDGWVRFESVDGSTDGWMADFLLADG